MARAAGMQVAAERAGSMRGESGATSEQRGRADRGARDREKPDRAGRGEAGRRGGIEIEIVGELASMVEVALAPEEGSANKKTALRDAERRSVKVVAGAGFEPAAFRL